VNEEGGKKGQGTQLEQGFPGKGSCSYLIIFVLVVLCVPWPKLHENSIVYVVFVNFWVFSQKPPDGDE